MSHQVGDGFVAGFVSLSHSERSHHSAVGACDDWKAYNKRAASVAGNEINVTHAPRYARRMRFTRQPWPTAIAAQSLYGAEACAGIDTGISVHAHVDGARPDL